MSTLFFDIYFATILFYAGYKLVENTENNRTPMIIMKSFYGVAIVAEVLLFISSLYTNDKVCIGKYH